jgi:uncharacterized membrane protein YraQ (UPF0718 family)
MIDYYYVLREIFEGTYTVRITTNFFELVWLVGPYFIISVIINAVLRQYLPSKKSYFSTGHTWLDMLIAAFVGLLSPFPTYIAVPMSLSLLITGMHTRVIFTFMLASPLMNPGIFLMTWSQLGLEIALARMMAALFIALTGGYLAGVLFSKFQTNFQAPALIQRIEKQKLWVEIWHSLRYLGKYFLIALVVSAAVKSMVPAETISALLGNNARMSVLAAIAMGVPLYSCGGAAIPLIEVLSEMGMNKGAVLAFFTAGPSTKIETLYIYKSLFGGYQVVMFYLIFSLLGAILSGFLYLLL